MVWINLRDISAQLALRVLSVLLAVSLLSPGCLIHLAAIVLRRSGEIILVLWFPFDEVVPKFLEVFICSCKSVSREVFYLPSFHVVP